MMMTSGADNDDRFGHPPGGQAGGDVDLRPRELTWAALLAQWLDFARASVALPADAEGDRWRASVAPIINLQAVTFALADLDSLDPDERSLGLDRAEWLIRAKVQELNQVWRGRALSPLIEELIRDAQVALHAAGAGRIIEFILPPIVGDGGDSDVFLMPDLDELLTEIAAQADFQGEIYLAAPGTLLAGGEPIATIIASKDAEATAALLEGRSGSSNEPASESESVWRRLAAALAPANPHSVPAARQVYRVIDSESGAIREDRIALLGGEPEPGRPLLLPVIEGGRWTGEAAAGFGEAEARAAAINRWIESQRSAWPEGGPPVRAIAPDRDIAGERLTP